MTTVIKTPTYPTDRPYDNAKGLSGAALDVARKVMDLFDQDAGPQMFQRLMDQGVKTAEYNHEHFCEDVRNGTVSVERRFVDGRWADLQMNCRKLPTYTVCADVRRQYKISEQQKSLAKGEYSVDQDRVRHHEAQNFETGRAQFFHKIYGKLSTALANRQEPIEKAEITISPSIPVEASLYIQVDGKTDFVFRTSIRDCVNQHDTRYWQYPGTFHYVQVGGRSIPAPSLAKIEAAFRAIYNIVEVAVEVPERVEATKQNLKSLISLWTLLADKERLTKEAAERRRKLYSYGTQGPRPQISRNATKLGLPKDITTEQARKILDNTLPQAGWDRLQVISEAGAVLRGKRGSDEAASDKLLKYLELIQGENVGEWPNDKEGYELSHLGRKVLKG